MSASHFTIYRLNTDLDWQQIIDFFNEGKENDKQFSPHTNRGNITFINISNYRLYTRTAQTNPNWGETLGPLVTDLESVNNISNSYVLFLKVEEQKFAITGGYGYQVLEKYKDYNFGLDLLSRLIGPNDNVIKRVNDRYFSGNILGGNYQFNRRITLNTGTEFNNFFNELYVALPSETIENKLGISINTKKENYRFLAKDSVRLGKAITLNELDILLGAMLALLNAPGYAINPFYQLNDNEAIIEELNDLLVDQFLTYLEHPEHIRGFSIIPYYHIFDSHNITINNDQNTKERYESEEDIIQIFKEYVDLDKEKEDLLTIIQNTVMTGEIEGDEETSRNLYQHFDVKLTLRNQTYWLMDGNWFLLEREFLQELNRQFIEKITRPFNHDFSLSQVNTWPESEKEGKFNFQHNVGSPFVFVLDKIFYENIEICDLLLEENDDIYFIHVKDGLDGDTRVLVTQIEAAMQVIHDGLNFAPKVLQNYYNNIANKIKEPRNEEEESELSISAKKFISHFSDFDTFTSKLRNKRITFVFAYRPKASHNFNRPETIQSTAAKLSMINLVQTRNDYDFDLKFMQIDRN